MKSLVLAAAALWLTAVASPGLAAPFDSDAFAPCTDASKDPALTGSLCARFQTPLRPADARQEQAELFVRQFPASGASIGQVWLISGGPGESGASFYPLLKPLRGAFPGYDLLIPDHRGTGFSTRLCPIEESSSSPGGTALSGAEWGSCLPRLATPRAKGFTITNAAGDLRALMDRYGDDRSTFLYGVSYGTQLVLRTLAVAPPRRLDGIILDSLGPPDDTRTLDLSHRSQVVDEVGRQILAHCDADRNCRAKLGGSAVAAMQAVVDDPRLAGLAPGGKPKLFFGALLDHPAQRAKIPDILAALRAGDGGPARMTQAELVAFAGDFMRFEQSSMSIPLVSLISASENNARPSLTKAQVDAEAAGLLFTSSLPGQLIGGADNAYPRDAGFAKTPAKLPPILVLQGDLDPKTPLAGAQAQIARLKPAGRVGLTIVKGGPHFLLLTAPDCFVAAARGFVATKRAVRATCSLE